MARGAPESRPSPDRYPRPARRLVLVSVALAIFASLFCVGCAGDQKKDDETPTETRTRPGQTNLRVKAFQIDGAESFPIPMIKRGLATRKDPGARGKPPLKWLPLIGAKPSFFNMLEWKRDLERIRTFYKARGYFDIQITRRTIVREPEEGAVYLRVAIEEGQPYPVSSLDVEGLEATDTFDAQSILRGLPLEEGKRFTEADYLETKEGIKSRLEQKGHAYAELAGRAFVIREDKEVRVRFIADPGPQAVFGDITIEGVESVPKKYVRQAVTFEPGDPYSSNALQNSQEAIYNLDVFSLVSVTPAHRQRDQEEEAPADEEPTGPDIEDDIEEGPPPGAPGPLGISDLLDQAQSEAERRMQLDRRVPIVIRVKEARKWNVRVGAGFALESNRQDIHGQANITGKNVFGGLQRLEFTNELGYAWAPGLLFAEEEGASNHGPIIESRLDFTQPWFGSQTTRLRLSPSLQRDVQLGYKFWNPSARVGIERTFFNRLTLGLGYRISYYNFDSVDPDLTTETPLGQDFQPEFILEYLEQTASLDYRNNPLNPTRGFLSELVVQEAGNYVFNGEFTYLKLMASTSGYIPVSTFTKMVLAMRFRAGTIYNLEPIPDDPTETQRVPTTSRLYSGGRGSMRTVSYNRLSIHRGRVPVGGSTMTELSFEPRFRLVPNLAGVGDLWAAPFVDAATALEGSLGFSTPASETLELGVETPRTIADSMIFGVGGGIWWVTPIGPVRADFGVTLDDLDADPRFPPGLNQYNFLLGIGHSF